MKRIIILFMAFLFWGSISIILADTLPLFFQWKQVNLTEYYAQRTDKKMQWLDTYRWKMGIDTTFTFPVRLQISLTQLTNHLKDQVVLDKTIVQYYHPGNQFSMRMSAEDFGFGRNWMLHQRRVEDPLNDHHLLLEYRWYGAAIDLPIVMDHITFGYGGNKFNSGMSYLSFSKVQDNLDAKLFVFDVGRDSQWNLNTFITGMDTEFRSGRDTEFRTRHAFAWERNLPKDKFAGHHTIRYFQETSLHHNDNQIHASMEYRKSDQVINLWQTELLLKHQISHQWAQELSVRYGEAEKITFWKPSLQFDYIPIQCLVLSLYYETILTEMNKTTHRFGFQTSFRYPHVPLSE